MTGIIEVVPAKTATFQAIRWDGEYHPGHAVFLLAEQHGWRVNGIFPATVRGQRRSTLVITNRRKKQYRALKGDWIIALGPSGAMRVCSDHAFQQDYRTA